MVQKNSTLKFESLWDLDLLRDDKQNRIYQTYMVEPFKMMDTMMQVRATRAQKNNKLPVLISPRLIEQSTLRQFNKINKSLLANEEKFEKTMPKIRDFQKRNFKTKSRSPNLLGVEKNFQQTEKDPVNPSQHLHSRILKSRKILSQSIESDKFSIQKN